MNRLLGNRSKPATDDDVAIDYNECVAEIKKENPYIGHLALQQEAMKRVAQRRAARQNNSNRQNGKEDFTPQRIAFRRKSSRTNKTNESNSPSRSFIGFLSSSTNTVKASNKGLAADSQNRSNHSQNLMAGRRTSTYNEDDAAHTVPIAHAMGDIELSDSDEDDIISGDKSTNSRRSSLSRKLSSLRGKLTRRQSSVKRRTSTNSSISSLQRQSSELSKDSTIEKSVGSTTDDDSKPRHKPETNGDEAEDSGDKKEEEEIMDFVEDFLAKGGTVHSGRASVTKARSRRASLFSVEENKSCEGNSVSKSITSLGDGSSSFVAADGSLICSWGRGSMNESELLGGDGGDLICNWESRRSILSNSSANFSSPDGSSERKKLPREIKVGSKPDDR